MYSTCTCTHTGVCHPEGKTGHSNLCGSEERTVCSKAKRAGKRATRTFSYSYSARDNGCNLSSKPKQGPFPSWRPPMLVTGLKSTRRGMPTMASKAMSGSARGKIKTRAHLHTCLTRSVIDEFLWRPLPLGSGACVRTGKTKWRPVLRAVLPVPQRTNSTLDDHRVRWGETRHVNRACSGTASYTKWQCMCMTVAPSASSTVTDSPYQPPCAHETCDAPTHPPTHVAPTSGVEFATGKWFGIELDKPVGKNNGTLKGVEYFTCPKKHGMFTRTANIKLLEAGDDAPPPAKDKVKSPTKKPAAVATTPVKAKTTKPKTAVAKPTAKVNPPPLPPNFGALPAHLSWCSVQFR